MMSVAITYRANLGRPLTSAEADANLRVLAAAIGGGGLFVFRGIYSDAETYSAWDVVHHRGAVWFVSFGYPAAAWGAPSVDNSAWSPLGAPNPLSSEPTTHLVHHRRDDDTVVVLRSVLNDLVARVTALEQAAG